MLTCTQVLLGWMRPARHRALRRWALVASVCALSACSAVQLAYDQAPRLTLWWINKQLNLDERQSEALANDLTALAVWHRQVELPAVLSTVRRWQTLANQEWTGDQVCAQADAVRDHAERLGLQALPALARLSLQLKPTQIQRMTAQHTERVAEFRQENLDDAASERLERRFTRSSERLVSFYGDLTPAQLTSVRQDLARSPYDPSIALAERERRHQDLLATISQSQQIAGLRPSGDTAVVPAEVLTLWRGWLQRSLNPPTPSAAAHNAAALQFGCARLAQWHQRMNPTQRQQFATVLQGYANDVQGLMASAR
jgi:hypothetical protein